MCACVGSEPGKANLPAGACRQHVIFALGVWWSLHQPREALQIMSRVDAAWTCADLAKVVCDELVAQGRLKEKPTFIR